MDSNRKERERQKHESNFERLVFVQSGCPWFWPPILILVAFGAQSTDSSLLDCVKHSLRACPAPSFTMQMVLVLVTGHRLASSNR